MVQVDTSNITYFPGRCASFADFLLCNASTMLTYIYLSASCRSSAFVAMNNLHTVIPICRRARTLNDPYPSQSQ